MLIDEIKYSDRLNLIKIKISDEYFFISYDLFNDLKLAKDASIDFDSYKIIVDEDEYNRCKNFALKQISYSNKTSFDIRKKLKAKNYSAYNIDRAIDFLQAYNFLDDENYVKSYIHDKSRLANWSKNKIFYKLKEKSIPEFLINKYLDQISDEEEFEKALSLAEKKACHDFSFENKQKVFRFLTSRGFSYDIISRSINEVFQ